MKDWRGTRIKVGSAVVYPSRQGSSLWMNEGEVISVSEGRVGVRKKGSKRTSYPDVLRLTVV